MTPPTNRSRSLSVCLSRHTLKFTRSMSGLGLVMIMRIDDDWWWWFWTLSIGQVWTRVSGSLAESESSQIESSQSSPQLHTALPQKPQSITESNNIALVDHTQICSSQLSQGNLNEPIFTKFNFSPSYTLAYFMSAVHKIVLYTYFVFSFMHSM